MEHPCPKEWNYENHPQRKRLVDRVAGLLKRLRGKKIDALKSARDTRSIHAELFAGMTPAHFTYYAGHYRGEPFRCLDTCLAFVPGDTRVGAEPNDVSDRMIELSALVSDAVTAADKMFATGNLSSEDKLIHLVSLACRVFDLFLQIHPYANGNGHAARFIMWAILGRYDFWFVRTWTVEPRPPEPPYTRLLLQHRAGDPKPLVVYVLSCLKA